MLTYTIVTKEFHFDNYEEAKEGRLMYINNGFKIISYGAAEDWYFTAEKKKVF